MSKAVEYCYKGHMMFGVFAGEVFVDVADKKAEDGNTYTDSSKTERAKPIFGMGLRKAGALAQHIAELEMFVESKADVISERLATASKKADERTAKQEAIVMAFLAKTGRTLVSTPKA